MIYFLFIDPVFRILIIKTSETREVTDWINPIPRRNAAPLDFLLTIGAIKGTDDKRELIEEIELWKDFVKLEPVYEGIGIQLNTMLIKHHFPKMFEEMSKGHVYSHYSLTMIKEAVLYTMEYLEKNKLFVSQKEFLERNNVKEWLGLEAKK